MEESSEIEKQFINPDMLRQFIEQLQKDFYFSESIQALEVSTLKPEDIFPLVCAEVKRLMAKDSGAL